MAVFRVRLSHSPGTAHRFKPGAEPDTHRKENTRWITECSRRTQNPLSFQTIRTSHDANPRPRRTSQI